MQSTRFLGGSAALAAYRQVLFLFYAVGRLSCADACLPPNVISIKRFVAPVLLGKDFAEAYITVKETVGNKIYSLELDELKKPSDLKGGTLKERYHIPEGYNKLLQKIKKASELLRKSEIFSNPDILPIDFSRLPPSGSADEKNPSDYASSAGCKAPYSRAAQLR